jgi:hypothetical protein
VGEGYCASSVSRLSFVQTCGGVKRTRPRFVRFSAYTIPDTLQRKSKRIKIRWYSPTTSEMDGDPRFRVHYYRSISCDMTTKWDGEHLVGGGNFRTSCFFATARDHSYFRGHLTSLFVSDTSTEVKHFIPMSREPESDRRLRSVWSFNFSG